MSTETVAMIGLGLTIASFYIGRLSDKKKEVRDDDNRETTLMVSDAELRSDLGHIKESLTRIEGQLGKDIARLDGRMDELSKQLVPLAGIANKAYESSKMAHNRITDHLRQDHHKEVVDYKSIESDESEVS